MNTILLLLLIITTSSTIYFARLAITTGQKHDVQSNKLLKDYSIVLSAFLEFLRAQKDTINKENESHEYKTLKIKQHSLNSTENLKRARQMSQIELYSFLKSETSPNQRLKMIDTALDENDLDMVIRISEFENNKDNNH